MTDHVRRQIVIDADGLDQQLALVLQRIEDLQEQHVTPAQIQAAVAVGVEVGLRQALASPEFWEVAAAGLRKRAESHAGRWLVDGMWVIVRKGVLIVAVGMIIYSFGGWSALAGALKTIAPGSDSIPPQSPPPGARP